MEIIRPNSTDFRYRVGAKQLKYDTGHSALSCVEGVKNIRSFNPLPRNVMNRQWKTLPLIGHAHEVIHNLYTSQNEGAIPCLDS